MADDTMRSTLGFFGNSRRPPPPVHAPIEGASRVLIYSHDTFGLGHLRRSRAIANALVKERPGVSVLIISGSPVIGNFEFGNGVDYVRVPGVTKLPDGDYRSVNLHVGIDDAVSLREALILQTARNLRPRPFSCRRNRRGFAGEVISALERMNGRGSPASCSASATSWMNPPCSVPEWERKARARASAGITTRSGVWPTGKSYKPLESTSTSTTP
jgi:predicted glycosyltransferase